MRIPLLVLGSLVVVGSAAAQAPKPVKPAPAPKAPAAPKPLKPGDAFADLWVDGWKHLNLDKLHDLQFELEHKFELMKPEFEHKFELIKPELHWKLGELEMQLSHLAPEFSKLQGFEWHMPDVALHIPEFQFPATPVLPPMAPIAPVPPIPPLPFDFTWEGGNALHGGGKLSQVRPEQGTPQDSLYRVAREALNRGEWARAATLFQSLEQKYPRSRVAPTALYYQAFALYRSGATDQLRAAVTALKAQQEKYPEAAADPDVAALRTRVYAVLASRGDAQAAAALRDAGGTGATCDKDDIEVRAEALNALTQIDPEGAAAAVKRVLARRDDCSVQLRRRAVYLLGRAGTEQATADLLEVARSDPDNSVRSDAISVLGRSTMASVTPAVLQRLFNESTDDHVRQSVLSALRSRGDPESRRVLRAIIERSDLPERLRAQAISQLVGSSSNWEMLYAEAAVASPGARPGTPAPLAPARDRAREGGLTDEDATFLRNLYGKTDSRTIKSAILSATGRSGGAANEQWLLGIVRNPNEDSSLRREALTRLKTSAISVEDLGRLYDALTERELRRAVVSQLSSREEAAATDKLIDIAKNSTDPQVRNSAIQALMRKKDPKATAFIRELVEKP